MRTIVLGGRPLSDMDGEDLRRIAMIEGCCAYLEYWEPPVVLEFDRSTFSDTYVIDYQSRRKEDGVLSRVGQFFLDFKRMSFHRAWNYDKPNRERRSLAGGRVSMATLQYLIDQGFDIPLR